MFRDSFLEEMTFYLSLILKLEWKLGGKALQVRAKAPH